MIRARSTLNWSQSNNIFVMLCKLLTSDFYISVASPGLNSFIQERREPQRGSGKHSRWAPLGRKCSNFLKWRILVYLYF